MAKSDESNALRSARTASATARDLTRELKRSRAEFKELSSERQRWVKEERKARKKSAVLAKSARKAEQAYDRATLKQLVRREEHADLNRQRLRNGHRVTV